MGKGTVNCKPVPVVEGDGYKATNRINLSVSHDKDRKLAYLSVYPCHVADGMMSTMLMSGKLVKIEDMPRLNAKRLQLLADEVDAQVAANEGAAWGVVLAIVEQEGLTLAGPAPAPTTIVVGLNDLDEDFIEPFDVS